jgi:hypothetical protein
MHVQKTQTNGSKTRATEDAVTAAAVALDIPSESRLPVTALAAAAVVLAAKDHALTADEEQQLKTRLQYRLYQRNHRAKKQRHAEQLVAEIAALRRQVAGLERQRQTLRLQVIPQIISGLVAAFRSPDPSSSVRTGESRLRAMLSENPHAERMVGQWRRLCERFRKWDLAITNTDVVLAQDTRVLLVSSPLSLRLFATRNELAVEFPALTERSLELLSARESITIHGRAAIRLDSTTRLVHSWALDLDLIASLLLLTQEPLQEVERIVSCSQSLRDTASDLKEMPKDELTRESEPHRHDCLRGTEPEVRRLSVDKLHMCSLDDSDREKWRQAKG